MAEYPYLESRLQAGDTAGALQGLPRCKRDKLPPITRTDSWLMRLWDEMCSPLAAGAQMDLLRFKCEAVGLVSRAAKMEAWERVRMVDAEVREYHALVAEAKAKAGIN